MYVLNWLKQKTQIDKTDVFGEKTYHAALDCFPRNRPIEITITGCQSILSGHLESCDLEALFIPIKSYYCTVTVFLITFTTVYCERRRSCFRNPIQTSQWIPGKGPHVPAVEITAFISFSWKTTAIFVRISIAAVSTVVWSWKESALRWNQDVRRR